MTYKLIPFVQHTIHQFTTLNRPQSFPLITSQSTSLSELRSPTLDSSKDSCNKTAAVDAPHQTASHRTCSPNSLMWLGKRLLPKRLQKQGQYPRFNSTQTISARMLISVPSQIPYHLIQQK